MKYGPAYMGKQLQPPVTVLPHLKAWHDIAFLQHKAVAKAKHADLSNLNYVISSHVANKESFEILNWATGLDLDIFGSAIPWDKRIEWDSNSDEFKAILASPNGRGVALLLITHKSTYGQLTHVSKITAWCSSINPDDEQINLLFDIAKIDDDDDDDVDSNGKLR
jgi:hypothetical protein